jgi:transposase
MVQPSFVPPPPIRALRELTRYRKTQVDARGQEIQRLEKVLQDAGVKLTSVASTVWSMSSRAMIEALIAGERDPAILADFAKGRMRPKREALTEAFAAHWSEHHSIVAARIIAHIDYLDRSISELSVAIGDRLDPFQDMIQRMCDVPGVQRTTAEVVIAETGGDMAAFATPEQLCSWAGLAPANHESAGKHRPAGTRKGGRWLKRALIESAKSASKTKDTYLAARYRRIARRRGKNRATVAVAHSILVVLWHLMADPELEYHDLGADYYDRRQDPKREADRIVRQLEQLGYHVTLEPIAA